MRSGPAASPVSGTHCGGRRLGSVVSHWRGGPFLASTLVHAAPRSPATHTPRPWEHARCVGLRVKAALSGGRWDPHSYWRAPPPPPLLRRHSFSLLQYQRTVSFAPGQAHPVPQSSPIALTPQGSVGSAATAWPLSQAPPFPGPPLGSPARLAPQATLRKLFGFLLQPRAWGFWGRSSADGLATEGTRRRSTEEPTAAPLPPSIST